MMSKLIFALVMAVQAVSPWKQATPGYTFAFPRDHASHPDYKIEWWYYTGNVKAADGRRFGLSIPSGAIPLGSGEGHLHACLAALALFEDGEERRP